MTSVDSETPVTGVGERRRKLLSQSLEFAAKGRRHEDYQNIVSCQHITDPLHIDTGKPLLPGDDDYPPRGKPRQRWPNALPFVFASYCNSLSSGSITTIALMLYAAPARGIDVLILYLAGWIFMIYPIYSMEMCQGQIWQGSVVKVFSTLSPLLRPIGILSTLLYALNLPIHLRMFGESVLFAYHSFATRVPWHLSDDMVAACNARNATTCEALPYCMNCRVVEGCYPSYHRHATNVYFDIVLGKERLSAETVSVNYPIYISIIIGVCIVSAVSLCNLLILGQISTFAGIGIFVFFTFFAIITSSLEGSTLASMKRLFDAPRPVRTGFEDYFNLLQIMLSTAGIIFGSEYTLASYNGNATNVTFLAGLVIILRLGTEFISAMFIISLASYVGSLGPRGPDEDLNKLVADRYMQSWLSGDTAWCNPDFDVVSNTLDAPTAHNTVFRMFPVTLGLLRGASIYSLVFFTLIGLASFVTITIFFLTIQQTVQDCEKFKDVDRRVIVAATAIFAIAYALPFCIEMPHYNIYGRDVTDYADTFVKGIILPIVGVVQITAVGYCMGGKEVIEAIGKKLTRFHRVVYFALGIGMICTWHLLTVTFGFNWVYLPLVFAAAYVVLIFGSFFMALIWRKAHSVVSAKYQIDPDKPKLSIWKKITVMLWGDFSVVRWKVNRVLTRFHSIPVRLPRWWSFALKYLAYGGLLIIFIGNAHDRYTKDVYYIGVLIAVPATIGVFLLGIFFPKLFSWADPPHDERMDYDELPEKDLRSVRFLRKKPVWWWEEFYKPSYSFLHAGATEVKKKE